MTKSSESLVSDDVVNGFGALSTAAISDALDRLAIHGQAPGIVRVAGHGVIAGRAVTVRYEPVGLAGGTVGDFIDDVEPGGVVVLANAGRANGTVWGNLLTEVANIRQVAATVIDGLCRDVTRAETLQYPLFARGVWMRTGKDRVQAEAVAVPVSIAGVRVHPGDALVGDADGVVVVPSARAEQVLDIGTAIEEAEQAIRAAVLDGERLDAARSQHGYHKLQQQGGELRHGSPDDR